MRTRQKDDQRRRGTDEERDEDTRHGYEALHRGILHLGHSVSVGRGTHTGFVGKKATSDPVADSILHGDTSSTASCSLRRKGFSKDLSKGLGDLVEIDAHDDERTQDIGNSHEGHDELSDRGDTLLTADDDDTDDECDTHTDDPRLYIEGRRQRDCDGVSLHHTSREAHIGNEGDREEERQPLEPETFTDIEGRSPDGTTRTDLTILLR